MHRSEIDRCVGESLAAQPITDLHTHCYSPRFGASPQPGAFLLWGIDEMLTYHYLVAEMYRVVSPAELPYERFWSLPRAAQADHVWKHLFVERTPLSEACRGVLTTLQRLGLEPRASSLEACRKWFAAQDPDRYVDKVLEIAGIDCVTMTNPVFDDAERELWLRNPDFGRDPRFRAVLRIDPLLRDWPAASRSLSTWGYSVGSEFTPKTISETKRFLSDWIRRMDAVYVAASLPPEFRFPAGGGDPCDRMLRDVLLPALADHGLPLALMIGARRAVNPALKDAGDASGKADAASVASLCREFPSNKFLVTMLAREDQHELCVTARKFGNLLVFGCWWFLNNPSLVEEITRMRIELLGTSFVPQHSDARILDQLIYKWEHSKAIIGKVLADKYEALAATGWPLCPEDIRRDAGRLLRENYRGFVGLPG